LTGFLDALDRRRIPSVLLRNYEGFPDRIGNDLDVFVFSRDAQTAAATLIENVECRGGRLLHVHCRSYVQALFFRVPDGNAPLHVDIYPGALTWHGLPYLDEKRFVADCYLREGRRVPNHADEALTLLLMSLLWGGFYKTRYRSRIGELLRTDDARLLATQRLTETFGHGCAPLLDAVLENREIDATLWARRLRRRLFGNQLRRNPARTTRAWLAYWWYELGLLLDPPGIEVRIMDVDPKDRDRYIGVVRNQLGAIFGDTLVLRDAAPLAGLRMWLTRRRALSKSMLVISVCERRQDLGRPSAARTDSPRRLVRGRCIRLSATRCEVPAGLVAELIAAGLLARSAYPRVPWRRSERPPECDGSPEDSAKAGDSTSR